MIEGFHIFRNPFRSFTTSSIVMSLMLLKLFYPYTYVPDILVDICQYYEAEVPWHTVYSQLLGVLDLNLVIVTTNCIVIVTVIYLYDYQ